MSTNRPFDDLFYGPGRVAVSPARHDRIAERLRARQVGVEQELPDLVAAIDVGLRQPSSANSTINLRW